jgi:hypothetical protein
VSGLSLPKAQKLIGDGQISDANSRGMKYRIGDRGGRAHNANPADTFDPERI